MKFILGTAIILTLIISLDPGLKFEVGDCIYKDKIQYKVIDIVGESYVISDYKIIVKESKAVIETRFIKGICQ